MYTLEQEVCIGLAWTFARTRRRMAVGEAYQWAKEHWPEFLAQVDTPTGRTLLRIAEMGRESGGPGGQ